MTDPDLLDILRQFTDYVQNERVRSYNEGFDAKVLAKRPAMFRVMDDNIWRVFSDEKEAADFAQKIGMDYHGLYVRDGR
jgi:hypothetical protein